MRTRSLVLAAASVATLFTSVLFSTLEAAPPGNKHDGQWIFRFDTFGDEQLWTDTLRMHEVIQSAVSPRTALSVGLKVDASVLPPNFLAKADLDSPATTVELLRRNAVVGVVAKVEDRNITSIGITCALCHSTVDNSVTTGVGNRVDGQANRDLNPGAIIALSPAVPPAAKEVYNSWGPGRYDPRFNQDGINGPVLIPNIFSLQGVGFETYSGDGPISYWNAYVGVTQMGGHGSFCDPRPTVDICITQEPDLVTPKLPALLQYQLSLFKPAPPPASFDVAAAERGKAVFTGVAGCASCHAGSTFTDVGAPGSSTPKLHDPAETGMDPLYASRSATLKYRTEPLRALWQHAPYFHDGSASTLLDVVNRYNGFLGLGLTEAQKADLVEYLKSI